MYSRFPLSLERIPRAHSCACLSLRSGCIVTGIITILYSTLALSMGLAQLSNGFTPVGVTQWAYFFIVLATHVFSLALSALMLVGSIREKPWMMRPWVVLKAVQLAALVLVFIAGSALHLAEIDHDMLLVAAAQFLTILIWFYMLTIVLSYIREIEDNGVETARLKQIDDTWYTAI
ncbi:hypothetical protein NE865_08507 [Phthorimaea operculella]|nr:hypothetical protein NE865_08507 [Phthorimaea operculella]